MGADSLESRVWEAIKDPDFFLEIGKSFRKE